MKKALVSGSQIVDVADQTFEVHPSLFWVDCPDNCRANLWVYEDGACVPPLTVAWNIGKMDCYPQYAGQTDVVFQVSWTCWGCEQNFCSSITGTTEVTYVAGSPYTPFEQLTESQVLGWIWGGGVDKTATEAQLQTQINELINPPVVAPVLPWA
jgi:hypothetical protein